MHAPMQASRTGSQQGNERGVRSLLGELPLPSVGDNVFHPQKRCTDALFEFLDMAAYSG